MTTRIDPTGPLPIVTAGSTATRTTDQPTRPFQAVMQASASAVVGGAEAAVRRLPGGPILAAAFRPTSGPYTSASPPSSSAPATTPEGRTVTGPGSGSGPGGTAPGSSNDPALEGMLDQNTDKNLYYIALQERISAENRLYTAYSNVLRVRHETMKNAIGNVR